MRIGGTARYFAELQTEADVKAAARFAHEKDLPLLVLGSGSNTVFADGEINAVIVRIKERKTMIDRNSVRVGAGNNLAMLINELAAQNLDLSPLTGIPGTVGGAIFGNAGQGPGGIWIDAFVREVVVFSESTWKTYAREECDFGYRESVFKKRYTEQPIRQAQGDVACSPVIWEAMLEIPSRPSSEVKAEIESLLKKRIETQPHIKTAGSCFKAVGKTPAWKLIDAAGLRGFKVGDVEIAQKHANFLLNTGRATFEDVVTLVKNVKKAMKEELDVEMRFIEDDGSSVF